MRDLLNTVVWNPPVKGVTVYGMTTYAGELAEAVRKLLKQIEHGEIYLHEGTWWHRGSEEIPTEETPWQNAKTL